MLKSATQLNLGQVRVLANQILRDQFELRLLSLLHMTVAGWTLILTS